MHKFSVRKIKRDRKWYLETTIKGCDFPKKKKKCVKARSCVTWLPVKHIMSGESTALTILKLRGKKSQYLCALIFCPTSIIYPSERTHFEVITACCDGKRSHWYEYVLQSTCRMTERKCAMRSWQTHPSDYISLVYYRQYQQYYQS